VAVSTTDVTAELNVRMLANIHLALNSFQMQHFAVKGTCGNIKIPIYLIAEYLLLLRKRRASMDQPISM
jgi:hypothetical protein